MQNFIKVQNSANSLRALLKNNIFSPRLGVILGTGLGNVADLIQNPIVTPFSALPDFPLSRVDSHAGKFVTGTAAGIPIIIQQGRCHLYEGYTPAEVCMGVRIMAELGVTTLIVTNAAGAVNPQFSEGRVMVIADQINFTRHSPLSGMNYEEKGARFPDMSKIYDPDLLALAERTALRLGIRLEKGVYLGVTGPQLETPAETRAFRMLGADAVGMSTVLEVIAARHLGLRILGFSCLSNKNLPDCMAETSLDEIVRVAGLAGEALTKIISSLLKEV